MKRRLPLLLVLLAATGVIGRLGYLRHTRARARLVHCAANLQAIATGMNWYAVDNGGFPPHKLGQLIPIYLKEMPRCQAQNPPCYECEVQNKAYTVYCTGDHSRVPRYTSAQGLLLK